MNTCKPNYNKINMSAKPNYTPYVKIYVKYNEPIKYSYYKIGDNNILLREIPCQAPIYKIIKIPSQPLNFPPPAAEPLNVQPPQPLNFPPALEPLNFPPALQPLNVQPAQPLNVQLTDPLKFQLVEPLNFSPKKLEEKYDMQYIDPPPGLESYIELNLKNDKPDISLPPGFESYNKQDIISSKPPGLDICISSKTKKKKKLLIFQ